MFFKRKSKKEALKCEECNSKINDEFSFCPYCGVSRLDIENEMENFGLIGRNNRLGNELMKKQLSETNLSITDKIFMSVFNNLMRNIDQQFKEQVGFENAKISTLPNGVKIKIGGTLNPSKRKSPPRSASNQVSEEQLKKMNLLPRAIAKTDVRRLSDKIIYELKTPGIQSTKDVFVSKLESGYEVKAIGDKKVFINSLPINLPITKFSIENDKLFIEFKTLEEDQ